MTNIRRAILAILIAVVATLGINVGFASAHANAVTATKQCQANGTYTVTWKVTNDFGLAETASLVSSTGGGTFAGFPISIASGNGQFGTATQSGITANSVSVVVKGTWTDQFTTNNNGSIQLGGNCPIQHQPVTLCHATGSASNPYVKITVDDDAVVKNGHDGHTGDIIPSFTYIGDDHLSHVYPGKNLDKVALLSTGCVEAPHYNPESSVVETPCVSGDTNVNIVTTTHTFHAEFVNGAWIKVEDQGSPTVVASTRPLNESELVTCVPTHEPKVVTVDNGEPKCGDTSVATTTTTTTYTYAYVEGQWVETATDTVTHGSRPVETPPCPTTPSTTTPPTTVPPTTVPPTTVPTPCVYNSSLPADSPLCIAPTTTTVAPATTVVVPNNTPLPRTGIGMGGLIFAGLLVSGGIVAMLLARRPRNA